MFLLMLTIDGPMLVTLANIVSAAPSKINHGHTTLRMVNGDTIEISTEYTEILKAIPKKDIY